MKKYYGTDGSRVCVIDANGTAHDLTPAGDLSTFCSGAAFSWGTSGIGAQHLALALCFDVLGDARRAIAIYHAFKWNVVAKLGPSWELHETDILKRIEMLEAVRQQPSVFSS